VLKVVCIMREELALGFSLTGVDVMHVAGAEEAARTVHQVIADREWGLVILEEGLLDEMEQNTREELMQSNVPLIVPVPGQLVWQDVEQLPPDQYVAELIRRAVGYQLDVQL
jgi:vacuolar-type H+-ATPase subunit F/Vma7